MKEFDLIVIGGGATGAGIALDATLRGLKTLIVEKNDFGSGTSSRSTKLVHGGVRYLEKAVKGLDKAQYDLVKEGLKERYRFLKNAPHLSNPLTLVTPLYKWYEIPYMYIGLCLYDFISGKRGLGRSKIVSKSEIIEKFPMVKKDGLKGGVRYYDGAFNDARMVIALLQSAEELGCIVKNYTEVTEFLYEKDRVCGVKLKDNITQKTEDVKGKNIINASGVFADRVRRLDDKDAKKLVEISSGVHIVLDKKFLPLSEGVMIPKTEDGRVLFMLPYLGKCLVGTTDEKSKLEEIPHVKEKDLDYLIRHIKKYFDVDIKKSDILSSWSGLRPLIVNEDASSTEDLVREHVIVESKSGLISIVGGKWTTYRKMAEEVLDYMISKQNRKNLHKCKTKEFKLVGSREKLSEIKVRLDKFSLENKIKEHLLEFYGDRALLVCEYIEKYGKENIVKGYPYLKAEVYYAIEYEFVKKPLDFLVRRLGLGLIDKNALKESIEEVSKILKESVDLDEKYIKEAYEMCESDI